MAPWLARFDAVHLEVHRPGAVRHQVIPAEPAQPHAIQPLARTGLIAGVQLSARLPVSTQRPRQRVAAIEQDHQLGGIAAHAREALTQPGHFEEQEALGQHGKLLHQAMAGEHARRFRQQGFVAVEAQAPRLSASRHGGRLGGPGVLQPGSHGRAQQQLAWASRGVARRTDVERQPIEGQLGQRQPPRRAGGCAIRPWSPGPPARGSGAGRAHR